MKKIILVFSLELLFLFAGISSYADKSTQVLFNGGITCSSNTVTKQIFGYEPQRTGYILGNTSNANVFLVYNSTGGYPDTFTTSNAFLFNAGSSVTDSGLGTYVGFIACQSTGTAGVTISAVDFGQ